MQLNILKPITKSGTSDQTSPVTLAVQELSLRKAADIKAWDASGVLEYADYIILAEGNSLNHCRALASYVCTLLKKNNLPKIGGGVKQEKSPWIVLDFGFVVIHIVNQELRQYYALDELFNTCRLIPIEQHHKF